MNACLSHTSEDPRGGTQRTADLCSYVTDNFLRNRKLPAKKLCLSPPGGHFHSKVIGMLVVFFGVQNSDFGIFRVFKGLQGSSGKFWKVEAIFPKTDLKTGV